MATTTASQQIREVWDLLPHPSSEHVVRLFARAGDRKFGDYARTVEDVQRFAYSSPGKNIYIAPNPTMNTIGTRHSAADVTHWSYLFLDLDPVEEVSRPFAALEEALLWLGEWVGRDFKRQRPIVIDSGRGAQAWIRLEDIILSDGQGEGRFIGMAYDVMRGKVMDNPTGLCTRKTARKTMGYWLKKLSDKLGIFEGCRLDTSCSDLPRVMRCPGTVNIKTGRTAMLLESSPLVHGGLADLLVTGTPTSVFTEPEPGNYPAGTPWQVAFNDLTRKAQTYLLEGKEEPGRHETMWHTARVLAERGISREQTRAALSHANGLMGAANALSNNELEHAIETAYGPVSS